MSKTMRIILAISCLLTVLMMSISLGCENTEDEIKKIPVPTSLSKLSLVQVWDQLVEATNIQEQTASLQSFSLIVGNDGKARGGFFFEFCGVDDNGKLKYFHAEFLLARGELGEYSFDLDTFPASYSTLNHPLRYFEELDKVGLGSIEPGPDHLWMMIDFQWGSFGYSHEYVDTYDIYRLEDGNLIPIDKISFRTNTPVGTIQFFRGNNNAQFWFITSDIEKADTVEYQ